MAEGQQILSKRKVDSDTVGYKEIIYNVENMVATITLSRPEAMNALTMVSYQELEQALGILFQTEDHKEGATAFVEKREPVFKGK